MTTAPTLGWAGIVRLGLVQAGLGAIVVLATQSLNRVMVIELALPAILPGALVALHYALQVLRPRLGYEGDRSGRRAPWILGGMAALALGGTGAAAATALMASHLWAGIALAVLAFALIGVGVGAAGTSVLVLLAKRVDPDRRVAAATIVWVMMIAGFVVSAAGSGHLLDPYSPERLIAVTAAVCGAALLVTLLGVIGVEGAVAEAAPAQGSSSAVPFGKALAQVWAEPEARRFATFVFVSMLAYSAQDLILEPFGGAVFGLSLGETTKLSGVQHGGVLVGMLLVAAAGSGIGGLRLGSLRGWCIGGCAASAAVLLGLAAGGLVGPGWPLRGSIFALGLANGAFAVAAIGSMMGLAGSGRASREGLRMGLFGAAQALAFGLGGLGATAALDVARAVLSTPAAAYAAVFVGEAGLFLLAGALAARIGRPARARHLGVHPSLHGHVAGVGSR